MQVFRSGKFKEAKLLFDRKLDQAHRHLETAVKKTPGADHVNYALALCLALRGDLSGSYQFLKRAIDIHPRNRNLARSDPDFAEFTRRAPISELM